MDSYLLLPRIKIHNANAAASTYTVGIPAISSFLGSTHLLERRWRNDFSNVQLLGTAIAIHDYDLQAYRESGYYSSLIGTANPLQKNRKTGTYERPPFVEEARVHLTVSLLLKLTGIAKNLENNFLSAVEKLLCRQKIAAGDVMSFAKPKLFFIENGDEKKLKHIKYSLMPSYAIIERNNLLADYQIEHNMSALDAMIDLLAIHAKASDSTDDSKLNWNYHKITAGYLVPLAVGFKDISGIAPATDTRDSQTEHHFVEPVVTLGELRMPYRFDRLEDILWHYNYDKENGLYLCQNGDK